MARDEAKVRVRLDTSQAKADLRGLVREGERAGTAASGGLRQAVSRGFKLVGAGAAIGAGVGAVRRASSSGIGDLAGETLGPLGAALNETLLGNLDDQARAARSAREETISAFGAVAGHNNAIPPGVRAFFENVRQLRFQEERGRSLFETDAQFRGPGIGALFDRWLDRITNAIDRAGENIAAHIESLFGSAGR